LGEKYVYFNVFDDGMNVFNVKYVKYVGEKYAYFNMFYDWY